MVLPLALHVRGVRPSHIGSFVPLETEPLQAIHQSFRRALDEPLLVGVLDPEDEGARLPGALGLAVGEQHVVHHEAGAADVQRSGWARREAHADLLEIGREGGKGASVGGMGISHAGVVLGSRGGVIRQRASLRNGLHWFLKGTEGSRSFLETRQYGSIPPA